MISKLLNLKPYTLGTKLSYKTIQYSLYAICAHFISGHKIFPEPLDLRSDVHLTSRLYWSIFQLPVTVDHFAYFIVVF